MKILILFWAFTLSLASSGQPKHPILTCTGGRDSNWVKPNVGVIADLKNPTIYTISEKDLKKGVKLIPDRNLVVKGFLLSICPKEGDILEYFVTGDVADAKMLDHMKKHDMAFISCINIKIDGKVHVLRGFSFFVE